MPAYARGSLGMTSLHFAYVGGFVAKSVKAELSDPLTDLSHTDRLRRTQGRKTIQNRGSDLKFGNLPVKVS
jgi:hypothetical protein